MKIECNVGGTERIVRLVLGVVLIALGFFGVLSGTLLIIGYVIGAIMLITGIIAYCPLNTLMGRNSCKVTPAH